MKTIIDSISNKIHSLESKPLSSIELDDLISKSQELTERLIILRYKAYEQQVFGIVQEEAEITAEVSNTEVETPMNSLEITPELEERPVIDFSWGDDEQEEPTIEEERVNSIDLAEEVMEEELPEVTEEKEEALNEEIDLEDTEEEVIQTIEVEAPSLFSEPTSEAIHEEKIEEIGNASTDLTSTVEQIKVVEKSVKEQYGIIPLETLIGSFTLNEKLQFINELFGGSSEAFTSSVKTLDSQEHMIGAREIIAHIAAQNQWDFENSIDIIDDFMHKICRRYAATLSA
jgi:uncharacterized protein with von Willebrand factor type A (vWA) domain